VDGELVHTTGVTDYELLQDWAALRYDITKLTWAMESDAIECELDEAGERAGRWQREAQCPETLG
jgi:hypothetical protein